MKKTFLAKKKSAAAILLFFLQTIAFLPDSFANVFSSASNSESNNNDASEFVKSLPAVYNLWITAESTKRNNKLHMIIHKNSRMHTALASIVFRVGRIDCPVHKNSIAEIIAQHLISRKLHEKLLNIVSNYCVNCENEYTEIRAELPPENVQKFFLAFDGMLNSIEIDEKDLEDCKEKIIIRNKLRVYNKEDAIFDNTLSQIYPNVVFNESALRSINVSDVKKFFEEHYKNGIVLLTVCGDCNWIPYDSEKRKIAEIFHADGDEFACKTDNQNINALSGRNIYISNKYMSNAVTYSYAILPKNGESRKIERAFLAVFANELFRNLSKVDSVLSSFTIEHIARREKDILSITLVPRTDISLDEIRKKYELFVKKLSSRELSKEALEKMAQISETSYKVLLCDLYKLNSYITDNYIAGKYDMAPAVIAENISAKRIRNFAKNILMQNQFLELVARYRADK